MWRGARGHCPACNAPAAMFRAYLKISDTCHSCGLHLGGHEADDAPPYFTIFIVGHVIIPVALIVERAYAPPLYVHAILFCVLSIRQPYIAADCQRCYCWPAMGFAHAWLRA